MEWVIILKRFCECGCKEGGMEKMSMRGMIIVDVEDRWIVLRGRRDDEGMCVLKNMYELMG